MEGLFCSCRKSLPPGFRFHPTDEELFMYYLKRKVMGKNLSPDAIAEVDVYRYAPWELPPMSSLKSRDLVWYFFCPRAKKYPNGGRANRATDYGYWKSTGTDRTMMYNSRSVGKIKTLIFHRGKPPKGERTDWVMHEYRLEDRLLVERGVSQDSYVICKIYEKSGLGPKNGESYGARFVEEEWDSDNDDDDDDDNLVKETRSEVVPVDLGVECVGDSPDGSVSGLTCAVASSNDASPFPTAIAAFDDTNAGNLNTTSAFEGTPLSAFEGTPLSTFVGNPNNVDTSLGTACAFTSSMASPSVVATAAGDGAGSGTLDEDDLDRLLNFFTEEFDNCNDLFSGLGDLGIPSGQVDLDWSDVIEMDDLK